MTDIAVEYILKKLQALLSEKALKSVSNGQNLSDSYCQVQMLYNEINDKYQSELKERNGDN